QIFSDIICPWCYIGTRLLWKAIAELSQNHRATEFRFKWRPYMIAPGVGEKGEAMRDFMQKRYGKALNRDKDLSEAALEAGVSLEGGLLSRQMWNSAAAHRLVQLAGEQQEQQGQPDLQTAMMEALFEAYFHREQNIAALACLQDLADKVGVSCEGLSTGSVAALAATYKEPAEARGVKGVPFFCISRQGYPGSFRFSGAQFPQTFVRAFQSLL
ncbi:thioredoxin-like protein, partial [Tribonema minus]